ncbi:hypothetical protein IWX49DRAFT_497821 [Phyllosticta citricarpa]|uniref:C2H2-type domain-containing protein n=2 Tax=Phyllosticta TaxID=121621 RepID=A0ABR1L764_9PEZI
MTPGGSSDQQFTNASSAQATPNIDHNLLLNGLSPLEDANYPLGFHDPPAVPHGPFVSKANSTVANGNLQPPAFRPIHHGHQLMSPCTTNHSSPRSSSEFVISASAPQSSLVPPRSFPQFAQGDYAWGLAVPQQQHTPAGTDSPALGSIDVFDDHELSIISPEIHVQSCSRGNSPSGSEINHSLGKKSNGSRTLGPYLSPYDAEATSDEDSQSDTGPSHSQTHAQRDDDGSWRRDSTSGLAGIGPEERPNVNDVLIPSINEMEKLRIADEKKEEVHKWLTTTDRSDSSHIDRSAGGADAHKANGSSADTRNVDEPSHFLQSRHTEPPESPAANVEIKDAKEDESYFPRIPRKDTYDMLPHRVQPWNDLPRQPTWDNKYQPESSTAAMQRFQARARDIETASVTATISSFRTRRRSESELASILSSGGISKEITSATRPRKSSILETFRRTPSLLRKKSPPTTTGPKHSLSLDTKVNGSVKRSGSRSRPKSPKIEGRPTNHSRGSGSHGDNLFPSIRNFKNSITRSRSPSQVQPGLSELITGIGGPPMIPLRPEGAHDAESDSSDEESHAPPQVEWPLVPTLDGFAKNAMEACRGRNKDSTGFEVEEFIVKRAAELHHRRYKQLLEQKARHLRRVRNGTCFKTFCPALGGQPKNLPLRAGKDGKTTSGGFRILSPFDQDEEDLNEGGTVVVSRLEKGVPIPPMRRLPAQFECPFCFEVKEFWRPSDWTQHVRDDMQPYFCTFQDCDCGKTWGRKADWKRHEMEKHRQLEMFKCNWRDCGKEVARKANFVQHLLREHKVPVPDAEPKTKGFKDTDFSGPGNQSDKVWLIVNVCRHERSSEPEDEPCRFCGVRSTSWKSVFSHLARHMEAMSLPIAQLVESQDVDVDTMLSPVEQVQRRRAKSAVTPPASDMAGFALNLAVNVPSRDFQPDYYSELTNTLGTSPSNNMTYPPPQIASPRPQPRQVSQQPPVSEYAVENGNGFANQSYPSPYISNVPQTPANNGFYAQEQLHGGYSQAALPTLATDYVPPGQVYQSPVEGPSFGADLPTSLYADNGAFAVDSMPYSQGDDLQFVQDDFEQFAASYTRQQQQQQGFYPGL